MDNEEFIKYLDDCITYWRKKRDESLGCIGFTANEYEHLVAVCYIDAFQSVRKTFCGECLPTKDGSDIIYNVDKNGDL